MDYNDLNSFLCNLEIKSKKNQSTNEDFLAKKQFSDSSIENKPKSRKQIENLAVNRNNDLTQFQNGNFNFESINPQRLDIQNTRMTENNDSKFNHIDEDYQLNRNLQVNSIAPRHVNLMDYSQFSENYKTYKNNSYEDENNINKKLSQRDNIPNISSVPSNIWDR